MEKLLYLASPYTVFNVYGELDYYEMSKNYHKICEIQACLLNNNVSVLSPICHTHPTSVLHNLPREYDFWDNLCRCQLSHCDGMLIATMLDWERSKGIKAEISICKELGIRYFEIPGSVKDIEKEISKIRDFISSI